MKKIISIALAILLLSSTFIIAQTKAADTVVIKVGESSKITFTIQNKNDLETLKKYDFQALMNDLISKLEQKDTSTNIQSSKQYLKKDSIVVIESENREREEDEDWTDKYDNDDEWHHHRHKRTYHSVNFDLGMNNYVTENGFPDQDNSLYTVKPWGSWYVGVNSVLRTRVANKFYLEWGAGVSWYNFKFENERTQLSKDDNSVIFTEDNRDASFIKSKLTATYINASVIPMFDFGSNKRKPNIFDGHNSESFRIGAGPYIGYRIDSYTKQVFEENGDKRKPKDHDNFYLNNIRYGLRAQVGFHDIDFFFNYDLNELFIENKGPHLNAFSFGVTF